MACLTSGAEGTLKRTAGGCTKVDAPADHMPPISLAAAPSTAATRRCSVPPAIVQRFSSGGCQHRVVLLADSSAGVVAGRSRSRGGRALQRSDPIASRGMRP
jgi:hypothetical protein